jgi:hypothetical protein
VDDRAAVNVGGKGRWWVRAERFDELADAIKKAILAYPTEEYKNLCSNAAKTARVMLFPPNTATWGFFDAGGRPFHLVRYELLKGEFKLGFIYLVQIQFNLIS